MKLPIIKTVKKSNTAETILIAAAAGAIAAGAVITVYELIKSERGQATVAKVKGGVINVAGKVKAKLPRKAAAIDCDCDLGLEDECAECVDVEA